MKKTWWLPQLLPLVGLLMLASACAPRRAYPPPAPYPPPPSQPGPVESEQPLPPSHRPPVPPEPQRPPPPRSAEQVSGPAVMALLGAAEQRAVAGDLDSAAASLERALDLEPRNPFVYQRLAALRLEQGQAGQAEALARKANSLAGSNPHLKAANWRIVAQSRTMRGDSVGAASASSRADYYQSQSNTDR